MLQTSNESTRKQFQKFSDHLLDARFLRISDVFFIQIIYSITP